MSSAAVELDSLAGRLFQLQLVAQANISAQKGKAVATAFADKVEINQEGSLSAGGNGITGTSSAVAMAGLVQTADQSNDNEGIITILNLEEGFIEVPQVIIQANLNFQDGKAFAKAVSGEVEIDSEQDPSGGDGVTGTSSAEAAAVIEQTVGQSNDNSTTVTFTGGPVGWLDDQPFILQANVSVQKGEAVAKAVSDDVDIYKTGTLEAGGYGIKATSSAVAGAAIVQSLDQTNSNAQTATLERGAVGQFQGGVIQANLNGLDLEFERHEEEREIEIPGQQAFVLAVAESGEVEVNNKDTVEAGGDGINATSSAAAGGSIEQTANQANTNSQNRPRRRLRLRNMP